MDVNVSVSNRQITPYKVAVKQFDAGVVRLVFKLDNYKYDTTDLRKYTPYVVTSINGYVDMTELTMTTSGGTIDLTWVLNERVLSYAGAITYQIVFKQVSTDGEGTSVYHTYQAIIQCSESVDAERPIASDYPTVLKQQFDLIRTLSGEFGHGITFMPVGEPIPLEERLDGRVYYQWLETPTTRAVCATGTLTLGSRPYADCGLYINNTHIYVDNTSETAYAIEPETWVEAINNANCGVTATSISAGGEIILRLIAATAGSAGNDIPIKLGLAQYGDGKNQTNPCNGTVSGSTLMGGADRVTGASQPTGRFEDAHGNILCYNRAKYIEDADLNTILEVGDYICSGTLTNTPVKGTTYCIVHVTDSTETTRTVQECVCVDTSDNSIRSFIRALSSSTVVGAWHECASAEELNAVKNRLIAEMEALETAVNTALASMVGFPDWSKSTSILTSAGSSYTAPSNGYLAIVCNDTTKKFTGTIGGFAIRIGSQVTDYHKFMSAVFPVAKGTVIKCTELGCTSAHNPCAYFLPTK